MSVSIDSSQPRHTPPPVMKRRKVSVDQMAAGIRDRNATLLARAITLVESTNSGHRTQARELLQALLPETGHAHRIGVTGVPGVGKSTAIEAFGRFLTQRGHRVAVLAVDPSSSRSGGSILGDKTRMEGLASDPNAFIRPSPSAGTLGGVARATRETMLLCEAAGYDVILVETVGVGQSETVVADMVDVFLVLMLPGAGDELQGLKKGILELADVIAINKADGDNKLRAAQAAREYRSALHIMTPGSPVWSPRVLTMSAATGESLDKLWETLREHHAALDAAGELEAKRCGQRLRWMWSMVEDSLLDALRAHPRVGGVVAEVEAGVSNGTVDPTLAGQRILSAFLIDDGRAAAC